MKTLALLFLCLVVPSACGEGSSKQSASAENKEVFGPFAITYTISGGLFLAPDPNGGPYCAERAQLTLSRTSAQLVRFCYPLEANRIISERTAEPNDLMLAAVLHALGAAALNGNIDVGISSLIGDDWSFEVDAQTDSKHFSGSGVRHSEAISSELEVFLSSLESFASNFLSSGL